MANKPLTTEQQNEISQYATDNPLLSSLKLCKVFPYASDVQIHKVRKQKGVLCRNLKPFQGQAALALDHKRKCPVCQEIKSLDDFYANNLSRCKSCETARSPAKFKRMQAKAFSTIEGTLNVRLRESKALHRKLPGKNTLTLEELLGKYHAQNGLCHYTGKPMVLAPNTLETLSIDRMDSSKGYISENVVLCRFIINVMKYTQSIEQLLENCNSILEHSKGLGALT